MHHADIACKWGYEKAQFPLVYKYRVGIGLKRSFKVSNKEGIEFIRT